MSSIDNAKSAEAPGLRLSFEAGTLVLAGPRAQLDSLTELDGFVWDDRIGALRARARAYRTAFAALYRRQSRGEFTLTDDARGYAELDLHLSTQRDPFPHQVESMAAWKRAGYCGVVVLPTGAGKSFVAELAIAELHRSTLIVAPTIDLMNQWYDLLTATFKRTVGIIGGGYYEVHDLTVTTYDSAFIHMEHLGDRFALLIFDEAHHLPSPSYAQASEMSIAPYRLGLTATPERTDGGHLLLDELVGPIVYRKRIKELAGLFLAEYQTVRIHVPLSEEDHRTYHQERQVYLSFVRQQGIQMGSPNGWGEFVMRSSSSSAGRRAFRAYWHQKRIQLAHEGKLEQLEALLKRHARDRVLIFTSDNETVYAISRRFFIPSITHKTPTKERKAFLDGFNAGRFPTLVTSKVLNEGVNIPEANIAIVLSGSGSVREHVQRLGRILRRQPDKQAILYELITADTAEQYVSDRRREHDAYR